MSDLFDLTEKEEIEQLMGKVIALIDQMPMQKKVDTINSIKIKLHQASPFKNEPVDCVLWVKNESVQANDYNPNKVAPPEMKLLQMSIAADGYTQPVVTYPDRQEDREHTVVDGMHRSRIAKECKPIRERIFGYMPIVSVRDSQGNIKDRMAATIRHNRARGVHGVLPMVDIVAELLINGWTDEEVSKELGMDADEVLRFKQNTGMSELFKDHQYSKSWE